MGGRGASSSTARGGGGQQISKMSHVSQIADYMQKKYGVTVDKSLGALPIESVREAVGGVEDVVRELPQVGPGMKIVYDATMAKNTYATARLSGVISVGGHYADIAGMEKSIQRDNSTHFHPKNGKARQTTSHEAGHIAEAAIIKKKYGDPFEPGIDNRTKAQRMGSFAAWNKSRESTRIIKQAVSNLKKTPEGKGRLTSHFISDVSRYATKNRSEALAECVADYMANGSKAAPLSREVWGILKSELG